MSTHPVLHAKLSLALRYTAQLTRAPEHIAQRHLGRAHKFFVTNLAVQNGASTLVQASNDLRPSSASNSQLRALLGREMEVRPLSDCPAVGALPVVYATLYSRFIRST